MSSGSASGGGGRGRGRDGPFAPIIKYLQEAYPEGNICRLLQSLSLLQALHAYLEHLVLLGLTTYCSTLNNLQEVLGNSPTELALLEYLEMVGLSKNPRFFYVIDGPDGKNTKTVVLNSSIPHTMTITVFQWEETYEVVYLPEYLENEIRDILSPKSIENIRAIYGL